MKIFKLAITIFILSNLLACSIPAPRYEASYDNVQLLKKASSPAKISDFQGASPKVGKISLRGNALKSPYGKDMIHYLQTALQSEFEKAGLLSNESTKSVTAVIMENNIDTSSFSLAQGKISVIFKVLNSDKVVYEETVSVTDEWESSFVGAVAIPRAAAAYPTLAKKLFNKLYSDERFIQALSIK